MPSTFTVTIDRTREITETLRKLAQSKVLVGIPSDAEPHQGGNGTEARQDSVIGNATLGYIHENGSPINNIPARPFLEPGVRNSQQQWTSYFQQAIKFSFEGNKGGMDRALHAAGVVAVSAVKNVIVSHIPPPLQPATIAARRRRTPSRQATSVADVTPLVDTGQLLNSIAYVIRVRPGAGGE